MKPSINFIEIENRVVSATYRGLMNGARVLLVHEGGQNLPQAVATIASPTPSGRLRISLPQLIATGFYYLEVLNGHGQLAARSGAFFVG